MKNRSLSAIAFAGLITVAAAGAIRAQTAPTTVPGQDPHHSPPASGVQERAGAGGPAQPPSGQTAPASGGMMQMMPPEMMQMMMRMMAQGSMMAGMGSPATSDMAMPGVPGTMPPAAPGMAAGRGLGPEVLYGMADLPPFEVTPEMVREWLQQQLDRHGNPRLALGEIAEAADGSVTAEIRTVDGALVQKLAFNRYPGFVRQVD